MNSSKSFDRYGGKSAEPVYTCMYHFISSIFLRLTTFPNQYMYYVHIHIHLYIRIIYIYIVFLFYSRYLTGEKLSQLRSLDELRLEKKRA